MQRWLCALELLTVTLLILQVGGCRIPHKKPKVYGPYGPVKPKTYETSLGVLKPGGIVKFETDSALVVGTVSALIDGSTVGGASVDADGVISVPLPNKLPAGSHVMEVWESEKNQLLVKATFKTE